MSSMANHEKSKKHKENLAALKLILQEETGGTQSLSDSDGSYSVDDSTAKCDRLSDNNDTHSDTVDGHGDTGNDIHANRGLSDTTQQLPNNTTNDRLDNHSVPSTDKGPNNDSMISEDEDDILLLLAKNKTKNKHLVTMRISLNWYPRRHQINQKRTLLKRKGTITAQR